MGDHGYTNRHHEFQTMLQAKCLPINVATDPVNVTTRCPLLDAPFPATQPITTNNTWYGRW